MKLTIELEVNENSAPNLFSELEHKVYQLHILGFSRANIALMLRLDYNYVKDVIVTKKEAIFTIIRHNWDYEKYGMEKIEEKEEK